MIMDLLFDITLSLLFFGLFGYVIYLAIVMQNLRTGKWKNGVGGLYFWRSDNSGIDIFFIPMRKREIEYADAHSEKWLAEQDRLKWRIRRVNITWLPWYLLQDISPEKFCEGLMNYFEEEEKNDE